MRTPMPTTRDGAEVLLVQPRNDGLHMYAEYLSEHGLAVIALSDAWDALIAAPKADIIVTDTLLAGSMDGVGLIGRLRRDEGAERRPIIVLTACAWDAERERATHAGCDVFLAKPCVPRALLRHVRASLADAALRREGGRGIRADRLNAPCIPPGVAADSTAVGPSLHRRRALRTDWETTPRGGDPTQDDSGG